MMGGVVGRLFREFAVVLSVAIAMSLLVSLTLTPVMASRLLRTQHHHGWLYNRTEALFNAFLSSYGAALRAVLNHRGLVLSVMLATVAASVYLYIAIPKGFFPPQDTGRLSGNIQGDESISYQALLDKALAIEKQVRQDPDVETVSMVAGASGGGGGSANQARLWIQLKPREERNASADAIIDRLRRRTANVVGATLYLQSNQDLRIGGRSSNAEYQYTLQGPDFAALRAWGPRMAERLAKLPQIADVSSDQQDSGLSANVIINHDAAARLGLTTQAIDTALYSAFGQRQVSVMYKSINQYHVVLGLDQRWQQGPQFLRQMYLQTPRGVSVPLSTFARFTQGTTPLSLPHEGQFPATTISFNLRPGASLSDAVDAINAAGIEMGLPANITGRFAGTARAFQESLSSQPMLVLTAFIAVYVMLGMLYESLIHPLTILSTLPSAGLGALVALVLTRTDLTIMALIGIILLIGIVQKNAIMMVDFALAAERDEGLSPLEAIYKASLLRFRPITMTTCAALLGAVPLAFASGTGSELRQPLGIAIIGGLAVSHMLTLFTTPVIYLVLDRLHLRLTKRKPRPRYAPGLTAVRP
jgi:multidrug efflux pump